MSDIKSFFTKKNRFLCSSVVPARVPFEKTTYYGDTEQCTLFHVGLAEKAQLARVLCPGRTRPSVTNASLRSTVVRGNARMPTKQTLSPARDSPTEEPIYLYGCESTPQMVGYTQITLKVT